MDPMINSTEPKPGCADYDVMLLLRQFATNQSDSKWSSLSGAFNASCRESNESLEYHGISHHEHQLLVHEIGKDVYAYMIPVIFVVGIIGNAISIKVFTSKVMRRLSSSLYLVALSISDILVLLTYVLFDWLNHGLRRWPGGYRLALINHEGVCQVFRYVSYLFRIISAWVIVIFAVERCLAVCWPLQRKRYCTRSLAGKLIAGVVGFSALVCLYKPILSKVMNHTKERICTRNMEYEQLNFVLESIYGLIITAVPSLVIMFLNMPILRRLISWDKARTKSRLVLKENRIRLEFTVIMLAISSCFIGLNLPYFVIWCRQFQQSLHPVLPTLADRISGELYITKMIFCINYSINFFMYCLTGAYYRREIKSMFKYYFRRKAADGNGIETPAAPELCVGEGHQTKNSLSSKKKKIIHIGP